MRNDLGQDEVTADYGDLKLLGKGLQKLRYLETFGLTEKLICVFPSLMFFRCAEINDETLNRFGKQMAKFRSLRTLDLGFG